MPTKRTKEKSAIKSRRTDRARSPKRRASVDSITLESPPIFQSRRIVKIKWKGKDVKAVEGLFAYQSRAQERVERNAVERALGIAVAESTRADRLGIGIFSAEEGEGVSVVRASSAAPRIGSDVRWVEPVLLDHISLTPNDTYFSDQWGLKSLNAERAWDLWTGSPERVVIAVLDSGIPLENGRLSHLDLNDPNRFVLGPDVVNHDEDPADDNGHGTHVIGIAAATSNNNRGVAGLWPGTALAIKIFDSNGNGSSLSFKDGVFSAVDFAREHDARLVINYSGGGPDTATKKSAVEYAHSEGALLVAAAGNDGADSIDYPAAYSADFPSVIAVGAIGSDRKRAHFSNRGDELTVVAPGVDILSTTPNYHVTVNTEGLPTKYAGMRGTSMAAPFVSALAALVWSQWPSLTAEEVRDKITTSADAAPGPRREYGHGIINAERALI